MITDASEFRHGCGFALLAMLLLAMAQTANAGGTASGPGLLSPTPSPSQQAQPVDSSRLGIALDYAFNDPIVKSELESIALSAATQGIPGASVALD
jgi:hypothetical protein